MNRVALVFAFCSLLASTSHATAADRPPNVVIVLADDLGYGDLGCYGHPSIRTPRLDRMAAEGLRFTDFYAGSPVCTPSRASLLTGRYAPRSGMAGPRRVLFPNSVGGLPEREVTIAAALKGKGYATACVGKWHLGHLPPHLPTRHGFDEYVGIPYSNDMTIDAARAQFADNALLHDDATPDRVRADGPKRNQVPLMRGEVVVEYPVDQATLTQRLTDEAIAFVDRNRDRPFFLYLAHPMPHIPLFASPAFAGKSDRGLYGAVVEELDHNVGRLLDHIVERKLDGHTLVVFTSDNGPWLTHGLAGGSAGLLREGKGSTWEGGQRVPAIAWWPGRVKAGTTSRAVACNLDLFTTALTLAGAPLPEGRVIDGVDLSPALFGTGEPRREAFYFYRDAELYAVRVGPWKAHFVTKASYGTDKPERHDPPLLYHLGKDPSERFDVAKEHPKVLEEIKQVVERHRRTMTPVKDQLAETYKQPKAEEGKK